jgi:hypothetical protein
MGNENERPDRTKIVPDYVLDPNGPKNGILQLLELTEGALGNTATKRWTQMALAHNICVSHLYLSGRRVFFAPLGTLDENLQDSVVQEGFEIGIWNI